MGYISFENLIVEVVNKTPQTSSANKLITTSEIEIYIFYFTLCALFLNTLHFVQRVWKIRKATLNILFCVKYLLKS